MSGQVFALLIGIDKYQAGNIWNLNAAVDDARSIERWLTNDLQVPRDHICTLLDSQATKRNIEERFLSHFVNNPAIEPGDALIFYYAGHGSSIRAPPGWFDRGHADVSVLCTYDYDRKLPNGKTNAGISDRSMHAMLRDLAQVKGDNITLILDTCFCLPHANGVDPKERRYTRYTPTRKATREDLLAGLWRSVSPQNSEPLANRGFTGSAFDSHVVLAASAAGWPATERKDGGNFTRALLALKNARSLHKLTYADLPSELAPFMSDHQHAACAGANADRVLFDGVPFASDGRFVAAAAHDGLGGAVAVAAGELHGVAVGTEFALHAHNRRGSLNGSVGAYVATQVFPTWCLASPKAPAKHAPHHVPRESWARITRWNSPAPFRAHVQGSLASLFRRACGGRKASEVQDVGIVQESGADDADVSVRLRRKALVAVNGLKEARLSIPGEKAHADVEAIESVARFHMHLHRKQPARPLADKAASSNWECGNTVVLHDGSAADLWPNLDPGGYSVSFVHHSNPTPSPSPPLTQHPRVVILSCLSESAELSFKGSDRAPDRSSGFLKLLLADNHLHGWELGSGAKTDKDVRSDALWDSLLASVAVLRAAQ